MEVKLSQARALFAACGFASRVESWPVDRVEKKLNQMDEMVDSGKKLRDPALNTLLRDVMNAVDDEDEITLVDDTKAKAKPGKPTPPPAKGGKGKTPPPDEEDDEDSELEDDDGEEEFGADEKDGDEEDEDDNEGEEEDGDSADDDSDEDDGGVEDDDGGEVDEESDLEDEEDEEPPTPKKRSAAKPAPKGRKPVAVVEDDEDEPDEDSELEDDEDDPDGEDSDDSEIDESDDDDEEDEVATATAKKPAAKKPAGKQQAAPAAKKPAAAKTGKELPGNLAKRQVGKSGMTKIDFIVHALTTKATKDKPLSKKQVLDLMCREFGEDQREAMANTVGSQIPNRLVTEKRVAKVYPVGNAYYATPLAKKKPAK